MRLEKIVRKDLREIGTSCESLKREALNRYCWSSGHSSAGHGQLGGAVS